MFKHGWILLVLIVLSLGAVSCKTDNVVPISQNATISTPLASSPAEVTDGSLSGDGWHLGQTPQSYNTGPNQVPASAEEVQRVKDSLKELEENQQTNQQNP